MITLDQLETGDILLFQSVNQSSYFLKIFDWLISWFTKSDYTHVAMILKNPTWIKPELKGLYIYESGVEPEPDAEDNQRKLGVQLTKIEVALKDSPRIFVRRLLKGEEQITATKLKKIHDATHNTLYDFFPLDLLRAGLHTQPDPRNQHTYAMFCSALVSYMCVKLDLACDNVDWSETTPQDLSSSSTNNFVKWLPNTEYSEDLELQY